MTKSARAIVELLEANLVRRPSSATLMNFTCKKWAFRVFYSLRTGWLRLSIILAAFSPLLFQFEDREFLRGRASDQANGY